MFLNIIWESDLSVDIYPLSKKSERIMEERGLDEFIDHISEKFGTNLNNHTYWFVGDKIEVREHKQKV